MQPEKSLAASKNAALQSVTAASRASRSGSIAPLERSAASTLATSSTALFVQTHQWPSRPPVILTVTSSSPRRKVNGVSRSGTMWSSLPVKSVMRRSAPASTTPRITSSVR